MTSFFASPPTTPIGSYVVARPARTDAIGDILRASFTPEQAGANEFKRLLNQLDTPTG